jgi:carboxypeptidase Q
MNFRHYFAAMALSALLGAPTISAWSQQPPESSSQNSDMKQLTDQLADSIYTGPSMATLSELADGIGGRLTGSPAYVRATEWAAQKFRSYGIQNVRFEPFTIPAGWQRGSASGALLAPVARPLNLASIGWAPSTPAGGVQGSVVLVSDVEPDALRSRQENIRGKIVFLDTTKIYAEGYGKALPKIEAAWKSFQKAGVLAVIMPDREKSNVLNAHDSLWGAKLVPLPAAEIGMEDAKLIQRELDRGAVTMQMTIENKTSGEMKVNNVIAEIRGSERPDEWILIGAHLDSWDFGTGAQDNGTGAVSVLEVARALMALKKPPKRSIRFALWGGEEQGLLGSYAYTQAHLRELNDCIAVLNTDNGAGHPKGWKVQGREDLKEALRPWSEGVLKDMDGGDISMDTSYNTDHGPFMLQGIPAMDLEVDMVHYMEIHHKSSDTLDKVDALDFKGGEAIVAVTAYLIAQQDQPIAPHIDHEAVAEIIKKAKLEDMLVNVGVWKP